MTSTRVLAVAQALAVDADVGRALFSVPALDAGTQGPAARRVRRVEERVGVADGAQRDLGDEQARQHADEHDQQLDAKTHRRARAFGAARLLSHIRP
jgi:hypothetical protein